MLERWITALHIEAPGPEDLAATRERLKDRFPRQTTRRMTQLGLLLGATLEPLALTDEDTLVYASTYAETRALEDYLSSFPEASPTLFQTSIHPSAVQQALIARRQAVRQFFPVTGGAMLPLAALLVALLAPSPRVVLCGGEERGSWLLEQDSASARTFAFAAILEQQPERAIGRICLSPEPTEERGAPLTLPAFFDHLHLRRPFDGWVADSRRLTIEWS
jgi:hypothetical protein